MQSESPEFALEGVVRKTLKNDPHAQPQDRCQRTTDGAKNTLNPLIFKDFLDEAHGEKRWILYGG